MVEKVTSASLALSSVSVENFDIFSKCHLGGSATCKNFSTYKRCYQSAERPKFSSVQSLSCVQLCNPMNHSTPGLPVHDHLLEFTQIHVHRVGDAIQPSHPLLSPSPPASIRVFSSESVLFIRWPSIGHQSFQCIFRTDFL